MPINPHSTPRVQRYLVVLAAVLGLICTTGIARAQMMDEGGGRHEGMHDRGMSGGRGVGMGLGIGLGLGIANELMRHPPPPEGGEVVQGHSKKKTKLAKEPKPTKPVAEKERKNTKKPEQPGKPSEPPVEKVVYTPPAFPTIKKLDNCDDCNELWNSIVWFEHAIEEDTQKLAQEKQRVIDRTAERAKFTTELASAKESYDKEYFTSMIGIADNFIKVRTAQIADMQKLIDEEWRILRQRLAEYQNCFDRFCPKPPVPDQYPLPPPSAPVLPPPTTINTPPPPVPVDPPPPPPTHVDDNRKICGPDITSLVLAVLQTMKHDYDTNPSKQTDACRSLLDRKTGGFAWDILDLSPGISPSKGMEYDPATDEWAYPPDPNNPNKKRLGRKGWFTGYSNLCAIPRPICGATVEFLGTCQHAQVVNYIQWGFMLELCGGLYPELGEVARKLWNKYTYGSTAPNEAQDNLIKAGAEFKGELDKDPTGGKGTFIPRIGEIRKRFQERDAATAHPEKDCELKCELTEEQRHALFAKDFHYRWLGLTDDATQSRTGVRDVPEGAREVRDKATER